MNINVNHHVLARSKAEILHLVELLIDNNRAELVDLLVDVVDIILHCIDQNHLRSRSLHEVFNPTCLFPQISHCTQTRRIAVGTKNGQMAMYELRGTNKTQMIHAHQGRIFAAAFGPDGKNLAISHNNKAVKVYKESGKPGKWDNTATLDQHDLRVTGNLYQCFSHTVCVLYRGSRDGGDGSQILLLSSKIS